MILFDGKSIDNLVKNNEADQLCIHIYACLANSGDFDQSVSKRFREHSCSVVECLTQDRGVAGSSLTDVTGLCP